jgi:uncharacterized repeat protein (TIGR01451 family)
MDVAVNVLPSRVSRMDNRTSRSLLGIAASAALLALSLSFPAVASADANANQVEICHTGNGTNYVQNNPAKTADAGGHAYLPDGKGGFQGHQDDIIPPFHYDGPPAGDFPGQNWDLNGQEIFANDCNDVIPDLVMLKTGTSSATVGDNGSYTLSVRNDGTLTLHTLTVTDTLPDGVELQAGNPPTGTNWTCTTAAVAPQVSCTQTVGH